MSDTLRLLLALLELGPRLKDLLGDKWPPYGEELQELAARAGRGEIRPSFAQRSTCWSCGCSGSAPAVELVERADGRHGGARCRQRDRDPSRSGVAARRSGYRAADARMRRPGSSQFPSSTAPIAPGATTRRRIIFVGAAGTLAFGIAEVSVPTRGRDLGELTSPSWWHLEFSANPEKHVILKSVGALGRDAFVTSLKDSLGGGGASMTS